MKIITRIKQYFRLRKMKKRPIRFIPIHKDITTFRGSVEISRSELSYHKEKEQLRTHLIEELVRKMAFDLYVGSMFEKQIETSQIGNEVITLTIKVVKP